MTEPKTNSPLLRAERRDTARQLIEQAGGELVHLGIVATFGVVSLIACVAWLLS